MTTAKTSKTALIVALTLALLVTVLGGISVVRQVDGFRIAGVAATASGSGWQVEAVGYPETGLEVGDQIVLADGHQILDLRDSLTAKPATTLVVLRAGIPTDVSYQRPPLALDMPYMLLALIGTIYLFIGLYTLLRDRSRQGLLFYLWCLASAAVYLLTTSTYADSTGRTLYLVEEIARNLLPAMTLHLFLVFPQPIAALAEKRSRRWLPLAYLPGVVMLALKGAFVVLGGKTISAATMATLLPLLDRAFLIHLVLYALVAVVVLVLRLSLHRDWEQKRQVQWIVAGLAGGYLPFLALYLVPYTLGWQVTGAREAIAVVPLALVPLTFAYAILRYKLWDLGVIIRDTMTTAVTLLLAAAGFSLAQLAIRWGLPESLGATRSILSFGSGVAVAGMLLPARRRLGSAFERIQYGPALNKRRALADFGRELVRERNLDQLCAALLERLNDGLEISPANLYLVDPESRRLKPVHAEELAPNSLAYDALGTSLWTEEVTSLVGTSLPGQHLNTDQKLFLAGYRYAFPLVVRDVPVGVLLTGYKSEGVPLNSEDEELILQLLRGASLAIENAQLLDELQQQLAEVNRLQTYNAGIIESSPAGIVVLDAQANIVSANVAFGRLVGVTEPIAVGRPLHEILPLPQLPQPGQEVLEVAFCLADGTERHLQLSRAAYAGSALATQTAQTAQQNNPSLEILVLHDISERVAMEHALIEQERLASLGMLAAGVAHEVNTPITGISSYAQMLLADTPNDDPRREILEKVERQTFRASRIVNNLLELARDREAERVPTDLVPLIDETLDLLAQRRSQNGVHLDWQRPDESFEVLASDGELQQVFTNLIVNAIDALSGQAAINGQHGDPGHLKVGIEPIGDRVHVIFDDDGPGIAAERLSQIFEPFFSSKGNRSGTGLGLSISREIIERHGGQLEVTSVSGQGTRFVVDLPRLQETDFQATQEADA